MICVTVFNIKCYCNGTFLEFYNNFGNMYSWIFKFSICEQWKFKIFYLYIYKSSIKQQRGSVELVKQDCIYDCVYASLNYVWSLREC